MFLSFLLPLVELFRQLIRPLTLMIRLRTNLSAGHIMLYMFSFFSLSSFFLSSSLFFIISGLMALEISISLLQAYIFTSLSLIYVRETL
jgi:F0F1-type ATP synthase membrane subunit a